MRPGCLALMFSIGSAGCGEKSTPGAQVVVLPGAAHLTPWDAREESVRTVRAFLRGADSRSGKP